MNLEKANFILMQYIFGHRKVVHFIGILLLVLAAFLAIKIGQGIGKFIYGLQKF